MAAAKFVVEVRLAREVCSVVTIIMPHLKWLFYYRPKAHGQARKESDIPTADLCAGLVFSCKQKVYFMYLAGRNPWIWHPAGATVRY